MCSAEHLELHSRGTWHEFYHYIKWLLLLLVYYRSLSFHPQLSPSEIQDTFRSVSIWIYWHKHSISRFLNDFISAQNVHCKFSLRLRKLWQNRLYKRPKAQSQEPLSHRDPAILALRPLIIPDLVVYTKPNKADIKPPAESGTLASRVSYSIDVGNTNTPSILASFKTMMAGENECSGAFASQTNSETSLQRF